jgi:hypothetical protein
MGGRVFASLFIARALHWISRFPVLGQEVRLLGGCRRTIALRFPRATAPVFGGIMLVVS